jgi:uncharacterized protein YunC (DUF1805 family)
MAEEGKEGPKSGPEAFAEGAEKTHKLLETLHGLAEKAHRVYETAKLYSPSIKTGADVEKIDRVYNLKDAFAAAEKAGEQGLAGQVLSEGKKALGHVGNVVTLATAVPHMGHGLYKMATGNNTEMEAGMHETFKGSYNLLSGAAGPVGVAVDKVGTHVVKALGYKGGDLGDFVAETGVKTANNGFAHAFAEVRGVGSGINKVIHGDVKAGLTEAALAVVQHDQLTNGGYIKTPLDNLSIADATKNVKEYEQKLEGKVVDGVHKAAEVAHKVGDKVAEVGDKAVAAVHKAEDTAVELASKAVDKATDVATKVETKVGEVAAKVVPPEVADQAKADYREAMAKPGMVDRIEGLGHGAMNFVRGVAAHGF